MVQSTPLNLIVRGGFVKVPRAWTINWIHTLGSPYLAQADIIETRIAPPAQTADGVEIASLDKQLIVVANAALNVQL